MIIATGMPGRVTLSVTFHSMTVRCEATCSEPRRRVAAKSDGESRDLLLAGWFAGLGKQLEPVELLIEHALYGWRDLVESANDESTDTIRELNAGVVAIAGQLPGHAPGNTGALEADRGLPRAAKLPVERRKRHADVRLRRRSAASRRNNRPAAGQSRGSSHRVNTCAPDSTMSRLVQPARRTLWLRVR